MVQQLSLEDIARLVQNPSSETRTVVAEKLGHHINNGQSPKEFRLAVEIAYLLMKDKEVTVRTALSHAVKHSAVAPRDMILALAQDTHDEVAEPVLQHSSQLTDDDLMMVIETTQRILRLVAVAKRKYVSTRIVGALVKRKLEEVSKTLVENPGAEVQEDHFRQIAEDFYDSQEIMRSFMQRQPVPVKAVKHMVEVSTAVTKQRILANRDRMLIENENTTETGSIGDEIKLVIGLGQNPHPHNCMQIAERFNRNGSLTPIFLCTILLLGNHQLFIACMACRSRIDADVMEKFYHGTDADYREFFDKSRLPFGMLKLFKFMRHAIDDCIDHGVEPNTTAFFEAASVKISDAVDVGIPYANRIGYAAIKLLTDYYTAQQAPVKKTRKS